MSEFTSPWLAWVPKNPRVENNMQGEGADKTDKSPPENTSVSFVSASAGLSDPNDSIGGALPNLARTHPRRTDDELAAEADPGVAMALDVFPGARVVSAGQPASWPPADAWVPTSARTIDVYAAEMPTAACPCCGATAWFRAGDGWTCSTCHPAPARADGQPEREGAEE